MKKVTDQTLGEMMGLGEREIARRFHALDFSDQDRANLRQLAAPIERRAPEIVARFYDLQLTDTDTALLIGDAETLHRLKISMTYYIRSLFEAIHDPDYVSSRLRIGKVHQRIGVTPRLYMRGLENLHAVLDEAIDELCREPDISCDAEAVKASLRKILILDAQLIFEAYVASYQIGIEATKTEVDRYAARLGIRLDLAPPGLRDRSDKDALTGLLNRRAMLEHLEFELAVARRHRLPLCLAYMDLNRFKGVNDRKGHKAGDEVLQALAAAMQQTIRAVDLPARIGGDEFCILMPRTTEAQCYHALERLAQEFDLRSLHKGVTLSGGVAQVGPEAFLPAADFLKHADELMYRAKPLAHASGAHHFCLQGGLAWSWPQAAPVPASLPPGG